MKIFYSWQSETPEREGRQLIREAAEKAIKAINARLGFEDAHRESQELILDQDTQGVLGSPDIVHTIFQKIGEADVLLADVTLTGKTDTGKSCINSNVAIETGYAIGRQSDRILLKVMNTYYGEPDQLPFDLKGRRWPIQYSLAPNADREQLKSTREKLADELKGVLVKYLDSQPYNHEEFTPRSYQDSPSRFWSKGEILVPEDPRRNWTNLTEVSDHLVYVRLWPENTMDELSGSEVVRLADELKFDTLQTRWRDGVSSCRNKFGGMVYAANRDTDEIITATQLFRNREIWGFDSHLLNKKHHGKRFIPSAAFEDTVRRCISSYVRFARDQLGYSDALGIEAGASNVNGCFIMVQHEKLLGPIYDNNIVKKTKIDSSNEKKINKAVIDIFNAFFDAAGHERSNSPD